MSEVTTSQENKTTVENVGEEGLSHPLIGEPDEDTIAAVPGPDLATPGLSALLIVPEQDDPYNCNGLSMEGSAPDANMKGQRGS